MDPVDPPPLSLASRQAVNRHVPREAIDTLPIPRVLKDDCFVHQLDDRHSTLPPDCRRDSPSKPCDKGCTSFSSEYRKRFNRIPDWSDRAMAEYGVHMMYQPLLASDAEWLRLPDRATLLALSENDDRLLACLNSLRFDPTSGLGDVHTWIYRFLYFEDYRWFHVTVRAGCMKRFVEAMRDVEIVMLPYGCVSDDGVKFDASETSRLHSHRRRMIVVVRDEGTYERALRHVHFGENFYDDGNTNRKIYDVTHLVSTIAYVSRPKFRGIDSKYTDVWVDKHYFILHPMVWHAIWWMFLLVPGGAIERFARFQVNKRRTSSSERREILPVECTRDGKPFWYAAKECRIENCVVRFHPLKRCIGDRVWNLRAHVEKGGSFVYWLGSDVLAVSHLRDEGPSDPKRFLEWCVKREMNTLLNLNNNSWMERTASRKREYDVREVGQRKRRWF